MSQQTKTDQRKEPTRNQKSFVTGLSWCTWQVITTSAPIASGR